MNNEIKFPFYVKLACMLISLAIIFFFLSAASQILVPILLSMLFAILLRPIVNFYNVRLRFPHVLAVLISVILFVLLITGIIFFITWRIGDIADDWNKIKGNMLIQYHSLQHWIKQSFHIPYAEQEKFIQQASKGSYGAPAVVNTLSSFTDILLNFILVPIYIFLFLLYRNLFLKFLSKLFKNHREALCSILFEIKSAVQSYLVGLLIELCIVSSLTSIGLAVIGVSYPVLLGVITGVLNLIPYIGILVAACLSIVATFTTSADLSVIFGVIAVNFIVQLIDNNLLVPMIVSSKVKINAFVSIVAIIIGGALAGVAGMFLAIPFIAILKVVFDHVEELKPWGFVMSDNLPKTFEFNSIRLPEFDAGHSNYADDEADVQPEKMEENKGI